MYIFDFFILTNLMIQLINLNDYFQQQSKNKYLPSLLKIAYRLQKPIETEYNNSNLNQLLQKYLLNEHFIVSTNQYQPIKLNNHVFYCAPAYVNQDICQHLFNHSYGNLNGKLLLYQQKPIFLNIKEKQIGGKREHGDYWHLYNYKARIHPFFIDFVLRAGLNSLWWNRFFLNFYPIEEDIKNSSKIN